MTQQGDRQASLRTITGKAFTYEGDWHALWDFVSVAAGTFDERMTAYVNLKLGTSYANVNDAMQALATNQGAFNFSSMGTFTASVGVFITGTAPFATNGAAYSWTPNIGGGTGPYTITLLSGALPTGTSIVANVVTGTVSATGTFSGVLRVTDALSNHADLPFSIISSAALVLTNSPATTASINAAYSYTPTTTGGRAPITWAITSKPGWGSFSTSTGALTGTTPGAPETDTGITIVGADADGRTVTTGSFQIAIASSSAPFIQDDFSGTTNTVLNTAISGRTTTVGAASWTNDPGATSPVITSALALTGTGELYGANNSGNAANAANYIVPSGGFTDQRWIYRRLSPNQTSTLLIDRSWINDVTFVGPTNLWNKMGTVPSGVATPGGTLATIRLMALTNASVSAAMSTNILEGPTNVDFQAGDSVMTRQRKSGATWVLDYYWNGHLLQNGSVDVSAQGITLNGNAGFGTALVNAAGKQVDDFAVGDPVSQAYATIDRINRVAQVNPDGSLTIHLQGDYTLGVPTLTYSYQTKSGVSVTGYDAKPLTLTSASGGRWTGSFTVASADKISDYQIRIDRTDVTGSGTPHFISGLENWGEVILGYGQSLNTKMMEDTSATASAGVQGFYTTATTNALTRINWRGGYVKTTIPISWMHNAMITASGLTGARLSYAEGGFGGTFMTQRTPTSSPSTIYDDMIAGIDLAGGDIGLFMDISGQFEITGAFTPSIYISNINAIVAGVEAKVGHTIKVLILPVGGVGVNGGGDPATLNAQGESVRQTQLGLILNNGGLSAPQRYYLGPPTTDLQHTGTGGIDQYHLVDTTFGFPEQARRIAYSWAKVQGYSSVDRSGPTIFSLTWNSATSLTVRFNKNGAPTMTIINTAFSSDFRGGLSFSYNDATFATQIAPTGSPTITDIDATYADLTFTFAASSFPTAVLSRVRGPYGALPFSRSGSGTVYGQATVVTAMKTNASIIGGNFADGVIPVQPIWDGSINYITAT